ncbi:MAG: hypothetical protein ACREP9_17345, partial [Candidatus Dormibacteraceae bacterium]
MALFGLLLVSYLGMVALLSTAWSHRVMARYVVGRIERVTGTRAEIAWLDVHPAVFRMIVHGLVLRGNEGPDQKPLLTAGIVDVTLNPVLLAARRLYIRRIDVVRLTVHLYTAADGGTNLPGPKRSGSPEESALVPDLLNLRVRRFSLNHSALYWNSQRIPLNFAAKGLALLLSFGSGQAYTGSFSSSSLRCRVSGRVLPSLAVATRINLSAHQLELYN